MNQLIRWKYISQVKLFLFLVGFFCLFGFGFFESTIIFIHMVVKIRLRGED